jgi:hypothetical protein
MPGSPVTARIVFASIALALAIPDSAGAGQRASQQPAPVERPGSGQTAPQVVVADDQDAQATRERLEELLKRLPPAVGRVLRIDPSLMANEAYLSTYPALAAFLKQHPEIRNTPGYFFEHVNSYEFWNPQPPETREMQGLRIWRDMLQFSAIMGVALTMTFGLIWILRTLVEHRRWHRMSKVHTEVNNKLLDRFTANEDLLAYIQTPAGRKFLESAPLSVDAPPKPVGAPFSRILWSIQIGIVLAAGALGLLYVSGRVLEEVAQPLFAIGVLALTVGIGFVASAGASFLLSRRLGLFEPAGVSREHSDSTAQSG